MSIRNKLLLGVACLAVASGPFSQELGHVAKGEVLNIVQTGITGAQSQLDVNHSYAWNFFVSGPLSFDAITAKFTLKTGPSTVADAVMTLWSTGSTFTPITSVGSFALSATSASQAFAEYPFPLTTSGTQLNGYYSLRLTSTAADVANFQWFIKGESSALKFENGSGQTVPGITYVPEPTTTLIGGMASAAMAFVAMRKRGQSAVQRPAERPV